VGGELGASELKESGAELFSPAGRRRLRLAALSTDALALAHSSACWYYDKRHVSASAHAKKRMGFAPDLPWAVAPASRAGRTEPAHHPAGFVSYRARAHSTADETLRQVRATPTLIFFFLFLTI